MSTATATHIDPEDTYDVEARKGLSQSSKTGNTAKAERNGSDSDLPQPGGRKRRGSHRRGGAALPHAPVGGRRRTRKSKGRKRQTRRR